MNILWRSLPPCFAAETNLIQCRNNSDAAQKKRPHSQISTDGARQSMLQAIKKGLCRPVGVIGFCWSGRGLCQDGQEGPVPYSFRSSGESALLPSVSSAPININLGVTQSNFVFFLAASSSSLWTNSAEVIKVFARRIIRSPDANCNSTLQHPSSQAANSPLQAHRHSRSTVGGVRRRWPADRR